MNTIQDTINTLLPDAKMLAETILEHVSKEFPREYDLSPAILIHTGDKVEVIEVGPLVNDNDKPFLWKMVAQIRASYPIVAIATEVWMAHCKPEDVNPDGRVKIMPRDNPNKLEKVLVNLWQGERTVTFTADITRSPEKSLGEWEVMFDSQFPGGTVMGKKGADSLGGAMMAGKPFPMEAN